MKTMNFKINLTKYETYKLRSQPRTIVKITVLTKEITFALLQLNKTDIVARVFRLVLYHLFAVIPLLLITHLNYGHVLTTLLPVAVHI